MTDGDAPTAGEDLTDDPGFNRLLEKLSSEHNFDFREYKRTSLARRIRVRMQQVRIDSFDRYIEYLQRHADEHVALFNTILINVTRFFRDPEAWKALDEQVLPPLLARAGESRSLRIWCVGASSGEEPYTVAILVAERLGDAARDFNVKIYGTDVDDEALATARQALYRVEDLKDVPTAFLQRHFVHEGQTFRLRRDLRRWCIFGRHNVAQDPPLSHIDLLICRNVLIYFTSDLQEKILARFHYAVREEGFLFLGRSESLLARSRWFVPVNLKWRIFQRTTTPAPTVALAMGGHDVAVAARPQPPSGIARLQQVVEALPSAIMVIDSDDNVLFWNAAAETLYDIPTANAVGRKFRDLDISYRIEGLRARLEEVKTNHIPRRLDTVMFTRRSGEPVHAEISIVPLLEDHRVVAVTVFATEATEHARLREQLTRVAEQHATAIEELQSTNEELETTNEELQSTNEELETTNEELQSTNEELETTVEELQAANTELATLNAELERRSAELKRLDEYQEMILSGLDQAVIVVDPSGAVTTWNETAARMWGLRAPDVVGRVFWTLPIGDVTHLAREPIQRVLQSGKREVVAAVPFVGRTGERRQTSLRLSPLRNSAGEVIGVIGVAADPV
jgi:two-component system CheB/CheR fusion protein